MIKVFGDDYEPEPSMAPDVRRGMVQQLLGPDAPQAWCELVEGLAILVHAHNNDVNPLHCERGELVVCSQPAGIAMSEIDRLEEIGFNVADDEEDFRSTRFGFG